MIFTANTSHPPVTGYVLTLLDGTEKDVLGIWGPYATENDARWALGELNLWPIDGIWDVIPLKYFPVPSTSPPMTHRQPNIFGK